MKIGLVGYQGSGKSTVFEWLTGQKPDPALGHTAQSAMVVVPEPRIEGLCKIYKPKKVSMASLELVDTPGLSRSHEGSAARLALIREAGCLVLVIGAFGRNDPKTDLETFDSDLILADMEIVSNRITRVEDSLRKPVPKQERETLEHEHATLKTVLEALEARQAAWRERHDRRPTQGHALVPSFWREAAGRDLQHGRRRDQTGAVHVPRPRRDAHAGGARRAGTGTGQDESGGPGRVPGGDGSRRHRSRRPGPHLADGFPPAALPHGRREGGPLLAADARRHGASTRPPRSIPTWPRASSVPRYSTIAI